MGIGENEKLLGDNKRTTTTPEVERPIFYDRGWSIWLSSNQDERGQGRKQAFCAIQMLLSGGRNLNCKERD